MHPPFDEPLHHSGVHGSTDAQEVRALWRAPVVMCAILLGGLTSTPALAQHSTVAKTVHNLSVTGPGEIKSTTETQICKFCHIPHSAVVPEPLWGHTLSSVPRYEVPEIGRGGRRRPAPTPDGSSRLCLSCHDGSVALGDVGQGKERIAMAGDQKLRPGRPGFLGSDLSGGHPISFIIEDQEGDAASGEHDMGIKPLASIRANSTVRLDAEGKMQCTTCHDPHSDRYYDKDRVPHFWVASSVQKVCVACHELK